MGRYYYGDIQGKFMFAVQPSNAGERFGAQEEEAMVPYFVNRKFYDHIVEELEMLILIRIGYDMKQNNNKMDKQREALRQLRLAEIHILNAFDVVDYIHEDDREELENNLRDVLSNIQMISIGFKFCKND